MLERYAFSFYEIVSALGRVQTRADMLLPTGTGPYKDDLAELRTVLGKVREECVKLALHHTADMAESFESRYSVDDPKYPAYSSLAKQYTQESIRNDVETLTNALRSELRSELFFRIPPDKERYFEKEALFGPAVAQAFPSCTDDIRNAGTCFALERYDASVFHLMQVLQIALNRLASKFGVAFEYANWKNVIDLVEVEVKKLNSSFGPDWKEQQQVYSQAASQFYFLKDAWRNHIMHARVRYDDGTALSILDHVRDLMKALVARGLSEPEGHPD